MIVVLTEKPSVGRDLARVLQATKRCDGYYEGNGYIITWAFGHLVELLEPHEYESSFKNWNLNHLPIIPEKFELKVCAEKGAKQQFGIIKKLLKNADSIICATDAGREGELIFRYIQQTCGCEKIPTKRLWISSLTDSAILEGFKNLRPLSDFNPLAAAARCRSEADWLIGMNATRGYTVKHSHGQGVLSIGRVQTPVLSLIVNRDQEIRHFKPEDYWEVWTKYRDVNFKHKKDRFKTKVEAEDVLQRIIKNRFQITDIEQKNSSTPPPLLFDLTEIQRVMNKKFGFPASKTLTICQTLYEKKYISYPRTDSRYLTDDIFPSCKNILLKLSKLFTSEVSPLNLDQLNRNKRIFNHAKVSDHHAIIPTGQFLAVLDKEENLVYREIVLRFIAVFYPNLEKSHTTVFGMALDEVFLAKGTQILFAGWFSLYESDKSEVNDGEQKLPSFALKEEGPHKPEVKTCKTKPPLHYSEATLLSAMETVGKKVEDEDLKEALKEKGLGTPATRASIIEILIKRNYIEKDGKKLLATKKGEDLISLLEKEPTLSSAEMTGEWEFKLKQIEKNQYNPEDFMSHIKQFARSFIGNLKNESIDTTNLGRCPLCSSKVIRGNTGYGCSSWKSGCVFRFHAEQFGTKIEDKDAVQLLVRGRLTYPRKLTTKENCVVQGYITLDSLGQIGMVTKEEEVHKDSLGKCPKCQDNVIEKFHNYACLGCEFVIWKKIAGREVSQKLAKILLRTKKTPKLNGFKSKAGKSFSASLKLESDKVVFDFNS